MFQTLSIYYKSFGVAHITDSNRGHKFSHPTPQVQALKQLCGNTDINRQQIPEQLQKSIGKSCRDNSSKATMVG